MQIDMPCFDALNPHIGQHIIWDTLETLAPPGEDDSQQTATRHRAVAAMLESLCPGTPFEAMLAAQIVAAHHGSMGCHRWSMQTDPASAGAARLRRDAMAMTRTMLAAEAALWRSQDRRAKAGGGPGQDAAARRQDPMHREDAAARRQDPLHREDAAARRQDPMHSEDAVAAVPDPTPGDRTPGEATPPAAAPLDLRPRERGKPDFSATAATIRALAARDPRTLTDDELETLGRARATPDRPYDASWRVLKPLPEHPRWEDLTPEQRRERYGYRTEEEIEADG